MAAVYSADAALKALFVINALDMAPEEGSTNELLGEIIGNMFLRDIVKEGIKNPNWYNNFEEQVENLKKSVNKKQRKNK